jgi:hypothetical protein
MKIYTDDPLVSYKKTTITPDRTRDEISAVLREYDVGDIHWHWKPEANDIYVQFGIEEVIDGIPVKVAAKVVCPVIWDKAVKNSPRAERRVEQPNLQSSMRAMFWYIKTHLESAYAMQSSRVAGFLSDIVTPNGTRFFDEMKQRLDQFKAVEYKPEPAQREVKVIKPLEVS